MAEPEKLSQRDSQLLQDHVHHQGLQVSCASVVYVRELRRHEHAATAVRSLPGRQSLGEHEHHRPRPNVYHRGNHGGLI